MTGYLVVHTDYEGLDILGLFATPEEAAERVRTLREVEIPVNNEKRQKWHALGNDSDEAIAAFQEVNLSLPEDPDRICVRRADEHGAECVCSELGVKPSKPVFS